MKSSQLLQEVESHLHTVDERSNCCFFFEGSTLPNLAEFNFQWSLAAVIFTIDLSPKSKFETTGSYIFNNEHNSVIYSVGLLTDIIYCLKKHDHCFIFNRSTSSAFKRGTSLRLEDLPSTLKRQAEDAGQPSVQDNSGKILVPVCVGARCRII